MKNLLRRLHADEQGANMVEYVLVVAAITLPILALVIIFRDKIFETVNGWWESIKGDATAGTNL